MNRARCVIIDNFKTCFCKKKTIQYSLILLEHVHLYYRFLMYAFVGKKSREE